MFTPNDLILFNGDSYTAPGIEGKTYNSYVDIVRENVDATVSNIALAGSSNPRIFKSTVEHINRLRKQYNNIIIVVGFSFVASRFEIAYQSSVVKGTIKEYYMNDYGYELVEDDVHTPKFITHAFTDNSSVEKIMLTTPELSDPTLLYSNFYTDIYMLANTLENLGIRYYFFSAARNEDPELNYDFVNKLEAKKWIDGNANIELGTDTSIYEFAQRNDINIKYPSYHLCDDKGYIAMGNYILEKIKSL